MIVHIMHDNIFSNSFIKYLAKHFDMSKHVFFIFAKENNSKYIEKEMLEYPGLHIINIDGICRKLYIALLDKTIKKYIKQSDKVFLHYLGYWHVYFAGRYTKGQKLFWIIFGGDLYSNSGIVLLEDETKLLLQNNSGYGKKFFEKTMLLKRRKLIKRINYACTVFDGDYDVLKEHYETQAQHIKFSFPNTDHRIGINELQLETKISLNLIGNVKYRVLLGNSADPTNNHASVLKALGTYKRNDFIVICPLSYGDRNYAKCVINLGKSILGDRFVSIEDYMTKASYLNLLNAVDVGIFNHYRQQAGGNICYLLTQNKKVYMRNTSIYQQYKAKGVLIHNINDLDEATIFNNLSDDVKYVDENIDIYSLYNNMFEVY